MEQGVSCRAGSAIWSRECHVEQVVSCRAGSVM